MDSDCLYFSVNIATFVIVAWINRTVAVEFEPVDSEHSHRLCIVLLELLHCCLAADLDTVAEPNS